MNIPRWLTPRLVTADWPLKLIAIGIALALWGYVKQEQTLTLTLSVPLELRSPPQTMRFARRPPLSVEVRLQVHRIKVPAITPKAVRVVVDLGRVRGRRVSIPLTEDNVLRPGGVSVLDITPSQLMLEFEPVRSEEDE